MPPSHLSHLFFLWWSSVAQSCLTLCNPMDCSMPRFPILHYLPELAHVHWVFDVIQLSCPLLSPSPPAFNLSQHKGIFFLFFSFYLFIYLFLICSEFCHTLKWNVLEFTCLPHHFLVSWFFASGGQSIRASVSASVLPMNIQDWSPLGWTGWISLQSKGLSRVLSNTTVQKHLLQFEACLLP